MAATDDGILLGRIEDMCRRLATVDDRLDALRREFADFRATISAWRGETEQRLAEGTKTFAAQGRRLDRLEAIANGVRIDCAAEKRIEDSARERRDLMRTVATVLTAAAAFTSLAVTLWYQVIR